MAEVEVRIVPGGLDLGLQRGEVLMAGAQRLGYRWPTVCGGLGQCMVCKVRIISGLESVSPETPAETDQLRGLRMRSSAKVPDVEWRLACQMRVYGDVVVEKRGVRPQAEK